MGLTVGTVEGIDMSWWHHKRDQLRSWGQSPGKRHNKACSRVRFYKHLRGKLDLDVGVGEQVRGRRTSR